MTVLNGTSGDDTILASKTGSDLIDGGSGVDTVVLQADQGMFVQCDTNYLAGELTMQAYTGDTAAVHYAWDAKVLSGNDLVLAVAAAENFVYMKHVEGVVGTDFRDVMTGDGDGAGVGVRFDGGAGDDWLIGSNYQDVLIGGDGSDRISGGDRMITSGGGDTIIGGAGDDWLFGGAGNDTFQLLTDDSVVDGVSLKNGLDQFFGGNGYDTIKGGAGVDVLSLESYVDFGMVLGNFSGIEEINGGDGNWHNNTILFHTPDGFPADWVDLNWTDTYGPIKIVDFKISTGDGDDTINATLGHYAMGFDGKEHDGVIADGGNGNDTINTGSGDDILIGGAGDDTLNGNAGNDTFLLETDDSLVNGASVKNGHDIFNGGAGYDTIRGGAGVDILNINANFTGISGIEEINGGDGNWHNNSIVFTSGADVVDLDRLKGDTGIVKIVDFQISAGDGNDTINASNGHYTLGFDGKEHDGVIVDGGNGNDTITTGVGDDIIIGGAGDDTLTGNAGNDTFLLVSDDSLVNGVSVKNGHDTYDGGTGYDTIRGGAGVDILNINANLTGISGIEEINGGDGNWHNNTIVFTSGADVVDLDRLKGDTGIVKIVDFEIIAGDGNDTINASNGHYTLGLDGKEHDGVIVDGGNGNDTITTGAGDDIIIGGAGDDTLNGNAGNDTFLLVTDDSVVNGASVKNGHDIFNGGTGYDTIRGGTGTDVLSISTNLTGFSGIEEINGGDGNWHNNKIFFTSGADVVDLDRLKGDTGTVKIVDFEISAGDGNDTINASNGHYTLGLDGKEHDGVIVDGGNGNDMITTGAGDDIIIGGAGDDTLNGNAGNDTFLLVSDDSLVNGVSVKNGHDIVNGGAGYDTIKGGAGIDVLTASMTGVEEINGGDNNWHNNMLVFSSGSDAIDLDHWADGGKAVKIVDFEISAGDGNDTINASNGHYTLGLDGKEHDGVVVDGGNGNDSITTGSGDDVIWGGAGDDTLTGNGGNDTFLLLTDDSVVNGASVKNGHDIVNGGTGYDTIKGGAGTDVLTASISGIEQINGGDGNWHNNTIVFSSDADVIDFNHWADGRNAVEIVEFQISAGDGDDVITASLGHYTLGLDGKAHDGVIVDGGAGNDSITTGAGDDVIIGGAGDDTLTGNGGNDIFLLLTDDALVNGASVKNGHDIYDGGAGYDTIKGGAGVDILNGSFSGIEEINGGDGNWHNNTIVFTSGADMVDFDHSADGRNAVEIVDFQISTGDGDDVITASLGHYEKGLDGKAHDGVIIDGGNGNDTITTGAGDDVITGGAGDDSITAGAGDDVIWGGAGDDTLSGNAGNDTFLLLTDDSLVNGASVKNGHDIYDGGAGYDIIKGGAGVDVLTGSFSGIEEINGGDSNWHNNMIVFSSDADVIDLDHSADGNGAVEIVDFQISAGDGDDTINASNGHYTLGLDGKAHDGVIIDGGAGNDNITTGSGDDVITGGEGDDTLNGNGGDDTFLLLTDDSVVGGASVKNGHDIVNGGVGYDTIKGGAGTDVLTAIISGIEEINGGDGNWHNNTIVFTSGADVIDLDHSADGNGAVKIVDFQISTGDGDDVITASLGHYAQGLDGKAHDGVIVDGGAGNDSITTGSGDDVITGGEGDDTLTGNGGDDTFVLLTDDSVVNGASVKNGHDIVNGGTGYDTIKGGAGIDVLTASMTGVEEINGGDGNWHNNTIVFTSGADVIDLDHSADGNGAVKIVDFQISAGDGDDVITASLGHYEKGLDGKAHDGVIVDGGAGNDSITTGSGDDIIIGGAGDDTLDGNAGDDTFLLLTDDSLVNGVSVKNGHDIYDGGAGYDTIRGGAGIDVLTGSFSGIEELNGGDGNWHNNMLVFTSDADMIDLDHWADGRKAVKVVDVQISAGDGNDMIAASLGHYAKGLDGKAHDGVIVDGGNGNDNITTGSGDDIIIGGAGDDTLSGNAGNDTFLLVTDDSLVNGVSVKNGHDIFNGGTGYDTIRGGAGIDLLNISTDLTGLSGIEEINGGDGNWHNNTIFFASGSDVIDLDHWADDGKAVKIVDFLISAGDGNDTINASLGHYTLGLDNKAHDGVIVDGGNGNDNITTGSGDDIIIGGAGDDTLTGNAGDDTFLLVTDDSLVAGTSVKNGHDIYDGGTGYDTIRGGAGIDILNGSMTGVDSSGKPLDFISLFGIDEINGGDGNWHNNMLVFSSGADVIDLDHWADDKGAVKIVDFLVNGGNGNDVITASNGHYSIGFDGKAHDGVIVDGGAGHDRITTGSGDDLIWGGSGNDFITCGAGNDRVSAGTSTKVKNSKIAFNTVTGGDGNDVFVVRKAGSKLEAGKTYVTDFWTGRDKIRLGDIFKPFSSYSKNRSGTVSKWVHGHMEVADINRDGKKDLVIHTRTKSDAANELVILGNSHFNAMKVAYDLLHDHATSSAVRMHAIATYDSIFEWGN